MVVIGFIMTATFPFFQYWPFLFGEKLTEGLTRGEEKRQSMTYHIFSLLLKAIL